MTWLSALVAVFLVVANGWFVAVEFAAVGSRPTRIGQLADGGSRRARMAQRVQKSLPTVMAGSQLGITVASLALGAIAEPVVAGWLEPVLGRVVSGDALHTIAFVVSLVVVSVVHTVFGEMVPKNLAIASAERSLLFLAPLTVVWTVVLKPAIAVLNVFAAGVLRLFGRRLQEERAAVASTEDLVAIVGQSHDEGLIDAEARALLDGALRYRGRTAGDVMVPVAESGAVGYRATVEEAEAAFVAIAHTRLPVSGEDGRLLGFLHANDVVALPEEARRRAIPVHLLHRMVEVSVDDSLPEVLTTMRAQRSHLAAVVGDGRRALGVLSLNDAVLPLVDRLRAARTQVD